MLISSLPKVNATLNALSALFLLIGYFFIRSKKIKQHIICMALAASTSVLFLISYLTYHFFHGATRFPGTGTIRTIYYSILLSHTLLAIVILPLVIVTIKRALWKQYDKHRAIARITFPLWLYVSITGVVIYWMLYEISYK